MSSEPRDLGEILQSALELDPSRRPAFLDEACAGDSALRREVESLIDSHERAGGFLQTPPLEIAAEALAAENPLSLEGRTIGTFRIELRIGSGGMGEVYRATDTRLGRTVAMKFLPARFSRDPELRGRLEREAQAISRLNHPNICTLYDVGSHEGIDYLVMEYLEGSTLEDRLKEGPLPLAEVLRHGIEMADALHAAHRQGVTHRDIKPGNIMLCRTGSKLLDFGLAKLPRPMPSSVESPSAKADTAKGMILGTFQYMSPEQLEGGEVDGRTDIFSLGAVLHEMATGRKAFEGKSQASLIAAIMSANPPMVSSLQPMSPRSFDHVVRRCLARDPEERWQTALDVKNELRWIAQQASESQAAVTSDPRKSNRRAWILGTAANVLVVSLGAFWIQRRGDGPTLDASRFLVDPPEGTELSPFPQFGGPAVSPDGSGIVFAAMREGVSRLYLRPRNSTESEPLVGTEGGCNPFWSADNSRVAYFAQGKLKSVSTTGGPPQTICQVSPEPNDNQGKGGTWNSDGDIVFATTRSEPLFRVSSRTAVAEQLTSLDSLAGERTHRWPWFLPDGRHFIYQALAAGTSAIYVGSLDSKETRVLLLENHYSSVVYAEPGYLLYVKDDGLMAQPFDANNLRKIGEAVLVTRGVPQELTTNRGLFCVSNNGRLVSYGVDRSRVVLRDRQGKELRSVGPDTRYLGMRLSTDGQRAVYSMRAMASSNPESGKFWVLQLESGQQVAYSAVPRQRLVAPRFSSDGSRVLFGSNGSVYASVLAEDRPTVLAQHKDFGLVPLDESHGFLLMLARRPGTAGFKVHLWSARLGADWKLENLKPFHDTRSAEKEARFSPDARWVAYTSDESGQEQVYVREFPSALHKTLISIQGGNFPVWSKDGNEIVYLAPNHRLTSVKIEYVGGVPRPVATRELFAIHSALPGGEDGTEPWWDMTSDGNFYLIENRPNPIHVVDNWTALNP